MPTYVAFLRAVNVGGRFVRMAELRRTLEDAGFDEVETHIQSGNVLVRSRHRSTTTAARRMSGVLGEWAGFDIPCIVRTPDQVRALVGEADAVPPMLPGEGKRYLAVADGDMSEEARRSSPRGTARGRRRGPSAVRCSPSCRSTSTAAP